MRIEKPILTTAALILAAGCAGGGQNLEPARSANVLAGMKNAATAWDNRVQVIAQTKDWPGDAKILDKVEAVRVRITNNGDQPVQIRYGNLRLVANDGTTYAAIPPLDVQGRVPSRAMTVVREPLFTYSGYMAAPYYVHSYPGIVVYDGPFAYDAGYYDTYARYWTMEELPTPEMIAWALPEGVLQPRGYIDGYVYFQRVPGDVDEVRFEAVMTAAEPQPTRSASASQTQTNKDASSASEPRSQPTGSRATGTSTNTGVSSGTEVASVSIPFEVD